MASEAAIQATIARRATQAGIFERPPYRVACPRCRAAPGEPCRRLDGEQRPAHWERIDVEDPQLSLDVT